MDTSRDGRRLDICQELKNRTARYERKIRDDFTI